MMMKKMQLLPIGDAIKAKLLSNSTIYKAGKSKHKLLSLNPGQLAKKKSAWSKDPNMIETM